MTPKQCIQHFGNQRAIARALDISEPSVSLWFKNDRIPELSQLRLEEVSRGALKADADIPRGWCRPMEQQAAA